MIFGWNIIESVKNTFNPTGYSHYSNDKLLDLLKSEHWGNLEESKRINIFQELENRYAPMQGRTPAKIVEETGPFYGRYNNNSNTISIDVWDTANPYECLDTYIHESNHALQEHINKTGGDAITNHKDIMNRTEMGKNYDGSYYNYQPGGSPYYDVQCDELESNNRAAQFLLDEKDRYMDDPAYREYLDERMQHFERVNETLKNDSAGRTALQEKQLETSWIRQDITTEQYESALVNVQNPDYVDETVQQSYEIEEEIKALNASMNEDDEEEKEEEDEVDIIIVEEEEEEEETIPNTIENDDEEEDDIQEIPNTSSANLDEEELKNDSQDEDDSFGLE